RKNPKENRFGLTDSFRNGPPSMRSPLSRPEQDVCGTSQTSIRHHLRCKSAMKKYAVAPIHTGGVAIRHGGPRDATSVPLSILTWTFSDLPSPVGSLLELCGLDRTLLPDGSVPQHRPHHPHQLVGRRHQGDFLPLRIITLGALQKLRQPLGVVTV